jgi:probable F420-dependent oxidoreductase
MALKDISFGMSLPHRSPDALDMAAVRTVAQRSEALGFKDLWVTENTIDDAYSFDPIAVLSYAGALTSRIGLGASVVVLPLRQPFHVAQSYGTLDYLTGGRAILGVGLGRTDHYRDFGVPTERRVTRFLEEVALIKALWTQDQVKYEGQLYHFEGRIALKPVQQPHPPIWLGGGHPDAIRRAAHVGDGWMGAGGQSTAGFKGSVPLLRSELDKTGKDPAAYPISKRVFMSVNDRAEVARAEVVRWFGEVYHNAAAADSNGIYGTPEQVRERLEELVDAGANHLLLNPVARYEEQVEALASVVGLR